MKSLKLSLFCILFITLNTNAQKNFKPATLITSDNVVLKGVVDDREWFQNPSTISFKLANEDKFRQYSPDEAQSVKVDNGSYYVSKTVKIDQFNDSRPETANAPDSSDYFKTSAVFVLAELITDKISLYSYTDFKQHLFVEKPNFPITELINRKYTVNKEGEYLLQEDKKFINQLLFLFENCARVDLKIAEIPFSISSVKKQILSYSNCDKANISYQRKVPKGKLLLGFIGGMSVSNFEFLRKADNVGSSQLIYNENFTTAPAILLGVRLQYKITGQREKASVITDLYFTKYKGEKEKQVSFTTPTFYTTRNVNIDFSMLRADILLRYSITSPEKGVSPFLSGGLSFTKAFGSNSQSVDTEVFGSSIAVTKKILFTKGNGEFNFLTPTLTGGGGLTYKKLSFEYRIFRAGRISKTVSYNASIFSHQFICGYLFN